MKLAAALSSVTAAVLLAAGACTASAPSAAGLQEPGGDRPEPVRPAESPEAPPLRGFALAVTSGATELFAADMERVELTHPAGAVGDAEADTARTLAHVRGVVAGLRLWAEDGAVAVDGPGPFTGRARSQTRGGVLRFSLTPRAGGGSAEHTLTAEVRGDEIVGRVWQRSPAGAEPRWTHSAFFRAPLRPVPPAEWPPRAPRSLSAERLPEGGVLLRWTVGRKAAPDAEYVVFRGDSASSTPVRVGATRELRFVDGAPRAGSATVWHVATRSARGAISTPSPAARVP